MSKRLDAGRDDKKRAFRGCLVVLSAPSGAGKTTICKRLAERNPDYRISISATTRKPRFNEKDGEAYYFLSEEEFQRRVNNGDFLEYQPVHGHYYGTLRSKVLQMLQEGYNVLFDIDVNGALQLKQQFKDAILIFIHPPSRAELERRLLNRKTDDPEEIQKRLRRLPEEYAKAEQFDYNLVNDDLERVSEKIEHIVRAHRRH